MRQLSQHSRYQIFEDAMAKPAQDSGESQTLDLWTGVNSMDDSKEPIDIRLTVKLTFLQMIDRRFGSEDLGQ